MSWPWPRFQCRIYSVLRCNTVHGLIRMKPWPYNPDQAMFQDVQTYTSPALVWPRFQCRTGVSLNVLEHGLIRIVWPRFQCRTGVSLHVLEHGLIRIVWPRFQCRIYSVLRCNTVHGLIRTGWPRFQCRTGVSLHVLQA